jgi:hypothetical protein
MVSKIDGNVLSEALPAPTMMTCNFWSAMMNLMDQNCSQQSEEIDKYVEIPLCLARADLPVYVLETRYKRWS